MSEMFFKRAAIVFFVCLFAAGCFAFSDYGISWDEGMQRSLVGEVNYNFIKTGNSDMLLTNSCKYYGPAFETLLYAAEKFFNLSDPHSIFILRHGISFLTFFIASICFYLLCFKIFKSRGIALLGSIMLAASPRIFADSFYNSKDLPMLCFCIIACYTMFLFIEKPTILRATFHALFCGIVLDIRILGLLLPIATLYLFIFQKEKKVIPLLVFIVYTLFFIIAFWPLLWLNPMQHFIEAFKQMSNYPVMGATDLYMGNNVPASNLPWHYLPVWIGITTPICYSFFFLTGLFFLIKNTLVDFKSTLEMQPVLFIFFAPVLAVVILNSTLYDGWRHLFFVYPFFLIIAVFGFTQLIQDVKNAAAVKFITYSTVVLIASVIITMVEIHPFQNVYFNMLAGNNIRQKYELDYWGLSYKQGLEYILAHDKSNQINIAAENSPGFLNFNIIPAEERKRLVRNNNINTADYFLSNFRNHPQDYNFGTSVFQINAGGEKIMEVLKLK